MTGKVLRERHGLEPLQQGVPLHLATVNARVTARLPVAIVRRTRDHRRPLRHTVLPRCKLAPVGGAGDDAEEHAIPQVEGEGAVHRRYLVLVREEEDVLHVIVLERLEEVLVGVEGIDPPDLFVRQL